MSNLNRLASDIADRIIHQHCDIEVRHAIKDNLLGMLGLKRRRPRKPNWRARDRFLAPHERRVASTLQGVWDKERRTVLANMKRSPLKTMRKDSSFIDSWLYPRATYEELIRKGVSKDLAQLLASSIPRIIGEYGLGDVSFEVVNQHALEWLRGYTPKLSENLEQINTDDLRRTLLEGIEGGEDMRHLRDRVNGLFDEYDRERAKSIAQTETIRAQERGNQLVYKESGFERKVWFANPDACELCEALNDVDVPIDEPYAQDVFGEDAMTPPLHPHCVLPGTLCVAPGGIVAGYRSSYRGQAIQFTFANGARLAVTPNHMLLTPHGFAAAQLLRDGDDVFYCPQFQGEVTVHPNNDGQPTLIEEIIESLSKSPGMFIRRVPVASEYLHGDGRFCNGDIDVIWADGLLERGVNPIMLKPFGANDLSAAYSQATDLSSLSPLALFLHRLATTTDGSMGSFRQSHPFFRSRIGHTDQHGLATTAGLHAIFQKSAANYVTANTESLGQGFFRCTGEIQGNQKRFVDDNLLARIDGVMGATDDKSSRTQSLTQPLGIASDGLTDLCEGQAGLIETTRIIKVDSIMFHGFVYDLQTHMSLYIANSIVSSNCRCASSPWDAGWAE